MILSHIWAFEKAINYDLHTEGISIGRQWSLQFRILKMDCCKGLWDSTAWNPSVSTLIIPLLLLLIFRVFPIHHKQIISFLFDACPSKGIIPTYLPTTIHLKAPPEHFWQMECLSKNVMECNQTATILRLLSLNTVHYNTERNNLLVYLHTLNCMTPFWDKPEIKWVYLIHKRWDWKL